MAGEHFTMADIPIGCEMHRWWGCAERPARPALERWYRTVSTRPGARGCWTSPGVSCRSHHAHGERSATSFRQIDVSHHPGFGNPVAVVLDADA